MIRDARDLPAPAGGPARGRTPGREPAPVPGVSKKNYPKKIENLNTKKKKWDEQNKRLRGNGDFIHAFLKIQCANETSKHDIQGGCASQHTRSSFFHCQSIKVRALRDNRIQGGVGGARAGTGGDPTITSPAEDA